MSKVKGPALYNLEPFYMAGVDPKTGLPVKMGAGIGEELKGNIKKQLRIRDEQDAVSTFVWENLPEELDAELLERILYYKGQGAFFYMEANKKFFFLPYALDGTIDVYGRFTGITPLPFTGSTDNGDSKKTKAWIEGLVFEPMYQTPTEDDNMEEIKKKKCVLLHDYTKQISQNTISRQLIKHVLTSPS